MKLIDFIIELAKNNIKLQNNDGSFKGGHNGPYNDLETQVRNTAHWLITLCKCYEMTSNFEFKDIVFKSAEFLCSKRARPFSYSFYHRNKKKKNRCNGLIGQAWTFEALVEASKILEDEKYLLLAEKVFLQHSFDYNLSLWDMLEINGEIIGIDKTFNHQLWFAACSSLIGRDKKNLELKNKIEKFMDHLLEKLNVLESGLIFHQIKKSYQKGNKGRYLIKEIKAKKFTTVIKGIYRRYFKRNVSERDNYYKMMYKSIGYHSFNMYAFALLKNQTLKHPFWDSELFGKTVNYILTPNYKNDLEGNLYGYPYNSPGFEVPCALSILSNFDDEKIIEISNFWVNEQIKRCYNKKTKMMDKNTSDPLILTARIYEVCRLPMDILDKIEVEII